jgi:hypothetical protein
MCFALLYHESLLLHCIFSDKGRKFVLDAEGLPVLLDVLERSISETGEGGRTLRNVAAGFLLNLLIGQEDIQQKVRKLNKGD